MDDLGGRIGGVDQATLATFDHALYDTTVPAIHPLYMYLEAQGPYVG